MSRFAYLRLSVTVALCLFATAPAWAAQTPGRITEVTVYRGQAMVTRTVQPRVEAAGLVEVIVTELPSRVLPATLYAEADDGIEIRSVRYRQRPVEKDVRNEVRQLDEQIQQVQDQIREVERAKQLGDEQLAYLSNLEKFTADTAKAELKQGVLNAKTLIELSSFIFDRREQVASDQLDMETELRELREKLSLLQRQRGQIASSSSTTVREAVVFADVQKPGSSLRLSYLVDNANWSPSYNIRASQDQAKRVTVEYQASIQQMSGEDWDDVKMTLSTASPTLAAEAPSLEPVTLAFSAGQGQQQAQQSQARDYGKARAMIRDQQYQLELRRQTATVGGNWIQAANPGLQAGAEMNFDDRLNGLANDFQLLELQASATEAREADFTAADRQISVTYELANRTSLPSRSDQQLIRIGSEALAADFYRIAMPVLTPYVYREAQVNNTGNRVLLAGPYAAYLDGQFVGSGVLPTVAVGEPFTTGFGIDASLRAARELVDKQTEIQGGNQVQRYEYRLTVENFDGGPVDVRVLDRIPVENGNTMSVELVSSDPDLSDDAEYQKQSRKNGILRWDITAAPRDGEPTVINYSFSLAHDRQLTITGLPTKR